MTNWLKMKNFYTYRGDENGWNLYSIIFHYFWKNSSQLFRVFWNTWTNLKKSQSSIRKNEISPIFSLIISLTIFVFSFFRPSLNKKEYKQLIGNIYDVLETHQRLLSNLEATVAQGPDARVGNLFLMLAPRLKAVHTAYCNGHPQAVCILDQYRWNF